MKQTVAIAIPIYKQYAALSSSEKRSLSQTYEVLGKYDIVFVTHEGIDITAYHPQQGSKIPLKLNRVNFPPAYFTGLKSYSQLLLSLEFYQRFSEYDYLLICQLDVFVFGDQLDYFINKGYDYIGAPWFEGYDVATAESNIMGVGNGGFSLRKVKSILSILYALELFGGRRPTIKAIRAAAQHCISVLRVAKHEYHRRTRNYAPALPWDTLLYEDGYWGLVVKTFFPGFKVGSIQDATAFAFEVNPSVLYALNHYQLPMATHAWEKYDPNFWKKFIVE
jgi:hypothetical protein